MSMILVATASPTLAQRIHAVVNDERFFVFDLEALLKAAGSYQPAVIVLGAKLGGQTARAVDYIPELLQMAPSAEVVVVTYTPSEEEARELRDLGAYAFVDADRPGSLVRLGDIIASAKAKSRAAKQRRQTRVLDRAAAYAVPHLLH